MIPEYIEATTIEDAWFQSLRRIIDKGRRYKIDSGSYSGQDRIELDFVTIKIKSPGTRPLLPKLNPNLGIPDPASDDYLDSYMDYLLTARIVEGEQYTYGQFIVPQMGKLIQKYKEEGFNTNQCTIMIGNEKSIYQSDPPCLRLIDTRIEDNKLNFVLYFRSWDCWGGFPINLAGLEYVKEYIALEIGIGTGETIACSKGLHIYDHMESIVRSYVCQTN